MVSLYRDPHGKRVFDEKGSTTGDTYSTRVDKSKIASLEQEIMSLRTCIKQQQAEVIIIKGTKQQQKIATPISADFS